MNYPTILILIPFQSYPAFTYCNLELFKQGGALIFYKLAPTHATASWVFQLKFDVLIRKLIEQFVKSEQV
jgi:hypothetical protein